tara:strand:+ start:475 stop:987 length:513 start_codon:yes stop_codon:yes gene_type:complete
MSDFEKKNIINKFFKLGPLIILYVAVLNKIDLNYLGFFSFNFPYILIFYWSLRKAESLSYVYIFIAGLINDVVVGLPIGITSFSYMLICGFAAYLKTITLRPNIVKDWFFFLLTILVVTSLSYGFLYLFFSISFESKDIIYNIFFTFALYIIFAYFFMIYQRIFFKEKND